MGVWVKWSGGLAQCLRAFLGCARGMVSASGGALRGVRLLILYPVGLGIPFVVSALLMDKLGAAFGFIKRHYNVINIVCGIFLIAVGIMMALGLFGRMMALFA